MPKGINPAIERQILQIIFNSGGTAGFTAIWEASKRSKSTIAKYLADCEREGLVERNKPDGQGKDKYRLRPAGETRMKEQEPTKEFAPIQTPPSLIESNKKGILTPPYVRPFIRFCKRINMEEGLIWRIAHLYSRLGEKVAQLASMGENPEVYWTVYYIFINSTENADTWAMNLREFCELCSLKQLSLEYYIDKIISMDLGLHRVKRGVADRFFLAVDEVGTLIRQVTYDKLDQFVFRREMALAAGEKGEEKLPLHEFAEIIIGKLRAQNLIPESWRDPFTEEIKAYIVSRVLERGLPADLLPPKVTPAVDTSLSLVDELRGFCAACGHWIQRTMRECPRCQVPLDKEEAIVSDIRVARDLARKDKEKQALETKNCPHCGSRLPPGVEPVSCPSCAEKERIKGYQTQKEDKAEMAIGGEEKKQ